MKTSNNNDITSQYPHLISKKDFKGRGQCVTSNIRKHLKHLYPAIKFSVKTSTTGAVYVSWVDGVTSETIDSSLSIFSGGHFDGMTDCYNHESNEFINIFDYANYIFTSQELSDSKKLEILERMNNTRHVDQQITFEQYQNNDFSNYISGGSDNSHHFYSDFREMTDAVLGGYKTDSEIESEVLEDGGFYSDDIVNEARKLEVYSFYISHYLYALQFDDKEQIEYSKNKILDEIKTKKGIETETEKENRLHQEQHNANVLEVESIDPIYTEYLDKPKTIKVRFPILNKNNTLEENNKEIESGSNTGEYSLFKVITLSNSDFEIISNNLMMGCKLWQTKEGELYPLDYQELDGYPCVSVANVETGASFIVDTQGHNYARYAGILAETIEVKKPVLMLVDKNLH